MVQAPLAVDIRRGALADLPALLADQRISGQGDVLLAVGPTTGRAIADAVLPSLSRAHVHVVEAGTITAAQEIGAKLREHPYDALVAIGGGRTIDVGKYAASAFGLPMVAVATNLAHDGIASPVSALDHEGRRGSYGVHLPLAVVIDLDYVRTAPVAQTRAGVGDVISNLNAVADWALAAEVRGERIDGLASALARTAAEAVVQARHVIDSLTFLQLLAESLVLSGISMAIAGSSRPCSGACHEISHTLDRLHPGLASHGEQVGMAALFAAYLRKDDALMTDIDDCLTRHGLPRLPVDLGLTAEQFAAVVVEAPQSRPDRYTILEHLALDADSAREHVDGYIRAVGR
jgi:glycerol-1-phosphate dehydrogenase [NAD(P)+]